MDGTDPALTRSRSPRPVHGADLDPLASRPKTRPQLAAFITRATIDGLWNRRTFREVERFFLVLGYNHSGSTLIGSLLNAHPEMLVAHETDILRYVRPGITRNTLFAILLQRDRQFAAIDRRYHGFDYSMPDSDQGRFTSLRVIGDKHAGITTRRLNDRKVLEGVRSLVGVPIRILYLVRNPFDNIAGMARGRDIPLSQAIYSYGRKGNAIDEIRNRLDADELFEIRYEQITADPARTLGDICRFIGVDATAHYLSECTALIDGGGSRRRDSFSWSPKELGVVEDIIAARPSLAGYTFAD